MAITPQDNSAFMREVDEEVRRDQASEFWKRWGAWLAGLIIVGLAGFGGWLWYSHSQNQAAGEEAAALSSAIERYEDGSTDGLDEDLAALSESPRAAIRASALLQRANLALRGGNEDAAAQYFAQMVADEGLPQPYRDLALIRQTSVQFEEMEPQAVIDRLAALAVPESPWFGSAGELTALAMMEKGDDEAAGRLWAALAENEDVPGSIRARAVQLASTLGVDAVPDEPVDMDEEAAPPPAAPPVAGSEQ